MSYSFTLYCKGSRPCGRRQLLRRIGSVSMMESLKCEVCTEDDGKGIHYHAFIDVKHRWICEACKKKLKVESDHMDD